VNRIMPVVVMIEWDNAKDESRYEKYAKLSRTQGGVGYTPLLQKMIKEGVAKTSGWTDNTGHLVGWWEFENLEAYAKLWADEEFHRRWLQSNPLVDNARIRILRPAVPIPARA
jgi:hypothetical protein